MDQGDTNLFCKYSAVHSPILMVTYYDHRMFIAQLLVCFCFYDPIINFVAFFYKKNK